MPLSHDPGKSLSVATSIRRTLFVHAADVVLARRPTAAMRAFALPEIHFA